MIFYHIQAHDNFDYLKTLLSYIYHPENYYFISIDVAVPAERTAELDELAGYGNISVLRNVAITWGGFSLVNSVLLGMRRFLVSPANLSHFMNISGTDFPLKTQSEMFATLSAFDAGKPAAWVDSHMCATEYFVENATPPDNYRRIRTRPDFEFLIDARIEYLLLPSKENAVALPSRRVGFMLQEMAGEKLHIVRPLLDVEYRARVALFKASGYRVGRAWHVFNREFCKLVLESDRFYNACQIMSGTLLPDESLFQTVVPMFPEITQHSGNYRFKDGAGECIDDGTLPELQRSDAFFARKVDLDNCRELMQWGAQRFSESQGWFRAMAASGPLPETFPEPMIEVWASGNGVVTDTAGQWLRFAGREKYGYAFAGWRLAAPRAIRITLDTLRLPNPPVGEDDNAFLGLIVDFRRAVGGYFRVAFCAREVDCGNARQYAAPAWGKAGPADLFIPIELTRDNVFDLDQIAPPEHSDEIIVAFGAQNLGAEFEVSGTIAFA